MRRKGVVALVAGGLLMSGCMTARTGEFYQETKAARIGSWWALSSDDQQFTLFSLVLVPVKLLFQGVDTFLVNPLWDTAMVPVDACFPQHGQLVRVVDENGEPVHGAAVVVEGTYQGDRWADYTFSKSARDVGVTDEDGLVSVRRRHTGYALFDCQVMAEGFHTSRAVWHAAPAARETKTDTKGRAAIEVTLRRVKEPIDAPVRLFSLPNDWTRGEQEWVRGYDLALSAWLPPFGRGKTADIAVAWTSSKAKGTKRLVLMPGEGGAAFARLKTRPFYDPRFFVTAYTMPALATFNTEICLQLEGDDMTHANVLDVATEYVAYRIRRPDGVHVGALVPTGVGVKTECLRNVYNPTPGSMALEYR